MLFELICSKPSDRFALTSVRKPRPQIESGCEHFLAPNPQIETEARQIRFLRGRARPFRLPMLPNFGLTE